MTAHAHIELTDAELIGLREAVYNTLPRDFDQHRPDGLAWTLRRASWDRAARDSGIAAKLVFWAALLEGAEVHAVMPTPELETLLSEQVQGTDAAVALLEQNAEADLDDLDFARKVQTGVQTLRARVKAALAEA